MSETCLKICIHNLLFIFVKNVGEKIHVRTDVCITYCTRMHTCKNAIPFCYVSFCSSSSLFGGSGSNPACLRSSVIPGKK